MSVTTFRWLYYCVVAAALVLFATLPFSRQLSFWVLGFDQSLLHAASVDSFRAYRETAFLRNGLFWTCSALVGASFLLSLIALMQWGREGDRIRTTVPFVVMGVAALLASVLVVVYIATRGPLI
jgi:hypothetical protein